MIRNLNQHYVVGTSALKLDESARAHVAAARIVKFPRMEHEGDQKGSASVSLETSKPKSSRLRTILESSEMYCSLITEDVKGCSYNLFSKHNVQILAAAGSAIAVLSLVFGV